MPSFKLDGKEIPFENGDTIIRAAWREGIEIPHYCWHPGLSVAANCRMCLVEVKSARPMNLPILRWDESKKDYMPAEKPKLTPACQAAVAEGMEVLTKSEEVKEAQASVQEFLLLNHPVDCPICDQAGECKLQDYWLDHQAALKRKDTEPVHKPKAVRFGQTIVYDAERCIMCTRCIRFCDEVAHDHALDMRERGNKNEIVLSPGRELDNRYTLMTEHVCPVGALTSSDFRFKARVWFLRSVPSVCPGCATGCNSFMDYDPRHQRVERLRPRDNSEVNQFWMCDDGMMTYKRLTEKRQTHAVVGRGTAMKSLGVQDAIMAAAEALRVLEPGSTAVVLSAQHSSEDNVALVKFAREVLRTDKLYLAALGGWQGDDILRHSDNNPNRAGAERAAGGNVASLSKLLAEVSAGGVQAVVSLGALTAETEAQLQALKNVPTVISLTSHQGALPAQASVVIPVTAHGEMAGTFVNAKGFAQPFKAAVAPPPAIKPAWERIHHLAQACGVKDWAFGSLQALRAETSRHSFQAASSEVRG